MEGQESEDLKNGKNGGGDVYTVSAMSLPLPSTSATRYLVLTLTLCNSVYFTDGHTQVQRIKMSLIKIIDLAGKEMMMKEWDIQVKDFRHRTKEPGHI